MENLHFQQAQGELAPPACLLARSVGSERLACSFIRSLARSAGRPEVGRERNGRKRNLGIWRNINYHRPSLDSSFGFGSPSPLLPPMSGPSPDIGGASIPTLKVQLAPSSPLAKRSAGRTIDVRAAAVPLALAHIYIRPPARSHTQTPTHYLCSDRLRAAAPRKLARANSFMTANNRPRRRQMRKWRQRRRRLRLRRHRKSRTSRSLDRLGKQHASRAPKLWAQHARPLPTQPGRSVGRRDVGAKPQALGRSLRARPACECARLSRVPATLSARRRQHFFGPTRKPPTTLDFVCSLAQEAAANNPIGRRVLTFPPAPKPPAAPFDQQFFCARKICCRCSCCCCCSRFLCPTLVGAF